MFELPLFPLNTVLFPGTPLKLHIFEERYKQMVNYCQENSKPFGVALIRSGQEVGEAAQPFTIGCAAMITQLDRLPDGRMNIVAVGQERFQIKSLRYDQPYLTGIVEEFPLINTESDIVSRDSNILRRWVTRYLEILAQASDTQFEAIELPSEPRGLIYLASFLLSVPMTQKQALLDISEAQELVTNLRTIYRREVTLLSSFLVSKEAVDIGPFSVN